LFSRRLEREVAEWLEAGNSIDGAVNVWGQGNSQTDSTGRSTYHSWSSYSSTTTDLYPASVYHLLQGQQHDLMVRYRAGEMTLQELVEQMKEVDKSLQPTYLDKEFTLYQIAEGQGEAGVALWRDDWRGENWDASLRFGSAEAKGNYDLKFSDKGLEGKVQGEAGVYAVRGQYNGEIAGANATVDAYIGAQARGEAGIVVGASGVMASAGASAFVGGRIDGSISKDVEVGGVKATGEARGSLSYGLGAKAEVEGGFDDGIFKLDADIGATVGLGAEVGFSVELDVTGAVDNVVDVGADAVDWGANQIGNIGKGIKNLF
jgi:hypothetical protein